MKDGCVTKRRRHSFKFCCSDKLGICLVFLITLLSLLYSKTEDFKPRVNTHSGTVKHCCYVLNFHFYAACSDINSKMAVLKSAKSYIKYSLQLLMISIARYRFIGVGVLLFSQWWFSVIPVWAFVQSWSQLSVYLRSWLNTVIQRIIFYYFCASRLQHRVEGEQYFLKISCYFRVLLLWRYSWQYDKILKNISAYCTEQK